MIAVAAMKYLVAAALLLVSTQSGFALAREMVCNNGAMVVRENPTPKSQRTWVEPDISATIYDRGVVDYLERTFGYLGDCAYGRCAYGFHGEVLSVNFYGYNDAPRTLDEPELTTSGKFSNAIIRREGSGLHLILIGGRSMAEWYFEHCTLVH